MTHSFPPRRSSDPLALRDLERNGRIELLKLVICGRVAHQLLYKHMLYFGGIGTRINFSDQLDNDIIPNRGSAARINIDQIASPIARLHRFRSEERRVGKECVSTCRSRVSAYN